MATRNDPWTVRKPIINRIHPLRSNHVVPCQRSTRFPTTPAAIRFNSGGAHAHETESYESFNQRYQTFFTNVEDVFELQRGLNNCFAYDLVPSTSVIEAALRAARKVDDYATAVRILEGVKEKVENKGQYQAYLDELKPIITELGECRRFCRLRFEAGRFAFTEDWR
jgi:cytochrome c oxidase subunit 5a